MITLPRDFAGRMKATVTQVGLTPNENNMIADENVRRILLVFSLPVGSFDEIAVSPQITTAAQEGLSIDSNIRKNLELPFRTWGGVLLGKWYAWGPMGLATLNVTDVSWIDD